MSLSLWKRFPAGEAGDGAGEADAGEAGAGEAGAGEAGASAGAGQVENSGSSGSELSWGVCIAMTTVLLLFYHLICSLSKNTKQKKC